MKAHQWILAAIALISSAAIGRSAEMPLSASEIFARLQDGGNVILWRHMRTDGYGDQLRNASIRDGDHEAFFADCSRQRMLDDEGKHDAIIVGKAIRRLKNFRRRRLDKPLLPHEGFGVINFRRRQNSPLGRFADNLLCIAQSRRRPQGSTAENAGEAAQIRKCRLDDAFVQYQIGGEADYCMVRNRTHRFSAGRRHRLSPRRRKPIASDWLPASRRLEKRSLIKMKSSHRCTAKARGFEASQMRN